MEQIGRRKKRTLRLEANPPVVLNLPAGHNALSEEEYKIYLEMVQDDLKEGPAERLVPVNAPPEEKLVFYFRKNQRTKNERENVRNWQLNGKFNATGDIRAALLFLEAADRITKKSREQIKRYGMMHAALIASMEEKCEEIRAVGGTPLAIPTHFNRLPALLKK